MVILILIYSILHLFCIIWCFIICFKFFCMCCLLCIHVLFLIRLSCDRYWICEIYVQECMYVHMYVHKYLCT